MEKLIIADLFRVKEIKEIEQDDIPSFLDTLTDVQVFRERSETTPAVGDLIKTDFQSELTLILPITNIPQCKYLFKDLEKNNEENVKNLRTNYFYKLNSEELINAKKVLKTLREDKDIFYRIVHHSYKMYWARNYSLSLLEQIITICDHAEFKITTNEELVKKLISMEFSPIIVQSVLNLLNTNFIMYKNRTDLWALDSAILFGSFSILLEMLDFLIQFSEDLLSGASIFFTENKFLKTHEAGAMDFWYPIRALRSGSPELISGSLALIPKQEEAKKNE